MTTKATIANGLTGRDAKQLAAIDECLDEMAVIRRRMKSSDARIRHADTAIRRSLDETWTILRSVQARSSCASGSSLSPA